MELDWSTSVPVSALCAALAMVRGRALIDTEIKSALQPVVSALQTDSQASGHQAEPLLRQLIPLVGPYRCETELARIAISKALGRAHDVRSERLLAQAIEQIVTAFVAARPRAADELPLRSDPLRSQWEARGPGLLAAMRRMCGAELLVPAARVVLVHPVLGGGGEAYPESNLVTFEGLLANPTARLPEVLRLGWLLGQLNFDLPIFQEPTGRQRLEFVGPLALIPIVLTAAEDVELACADAEHLRLAADSWLGRPQTAGVLGLWWETYKATRPTWPVAMSALDAMLTAQTGE